MAEALSMVERKKLREDLLAADDKFVFDIPKVELHVHIEGTITPELRWKLAQRNGIKLKLGKNTPELHNLEELKAALDTIQPHPSGDATEDEKHVLFFEAYYEGFQVQKTKEDFFDLAMDFFEHLASLNVRYCEPFFDPQMHTKRGVPLKDVMDGYREAQVKAEKELNVKSAWIMCFLRDESLESAMEHYKAALPYRHMIVGIGLDSVEDDNPPSKFEEVFLMARRDGFRLTAHCDVGVKDSLEHIREVVSDMAGTGADRIDHGLHAAEEPELVELILKEDLGMTICPWSYLRYEPGKELGVKIRTLFDAGIPITINSDDPTYMEDTWTLHNLLLAKQMCGFSDKEIATLQRNAINISWADQSVKDDILEEIDAVYSNFYPP